MAKPVCQLCNRPQYARGWCAKHWSRWRRHGDPAAIKKAANGSAINHLNERHGRARLTEAQVRDILAMRGKRTLDSIAREFGVSFQQVGKIMNGARWKHVKNLGEEKHA